MRTIDADELKEDFKSRLAACDEWIEKAKDKETRIRASAVKAYLAEVIMTIDNAPTVSDYLTEIARKNFELGRSIGKAESEIVKKITIERTQKGGAECISYDALDGMPMISKKMNGGAENG